MKRKGCNSASRLKPDTTTGQQRIYPACLKVTLLEWSHPIVATSLGVRPKSPQGLTSDHTPLRRTAEQSTAEIDSICEKRLNHPLNPSPQSQNRIGPVEMKMRLQPQYLPLIRAVPLISHTLKWWPSQTVSEVRASQEEPCIPQGICLWLDSWLYIFCCRYHSDYCSSFIDCLMSNWPADRYVLWTHWFRTELTSTFFLVVPFQNFSKGRMLQYARYFYQWLTRLGSSYIRMFWSRRMLIQTVDWTDLETHTLSDLIGASNMPPAVS